jgi:PAS domain S-box-containing protein
LVGAAYFLAARLGLALLTEPEKVAVFWPASGIAAGVMIWLGRAGRIPVAVGVVAATIAANLMGDRNLLTAALFGICNAGEALLAAWLIGRWFDHPFRLDRVNQVLGLLLASAAATGLAAVGGALTIGLFHTTAPFWSAWRIWFLSDLMGIITMAPLAIGVGQMLREPPARSEWIEGGLVIALLGAVSGLTLVPDEVSWLTLEPLALLFPLLVWVAASCRPVFAAAAAFVVGIALVATTILGIGRFGDPAIEAVVRVHAAQIALLVTTGCALLLAALFDERRRNAQALQLGHESLKLALDGAELGAFTVDLASGRLECDTRAAWIHGHCVPPATLKEGRRYILREDLATIDLAFLEARRTGGVGRAEYRIEHPDGHPHASQVRWVAFEFSIVSNLKGRPVRLLGVTRDVTERRDAEERLRRQVAVEQRVLGQISAGVPLKDVLDELIRSAEEQSEAGLMGSILILDKTGKRLCHCSAPSLPQAYVDAIDGAAIGPATGSCGTAAFHGELVVCADIASDPLWADYRHVAMSHGLRACWSAPIRAVDGRVLGTFANYYREPRGPTERDLEAIAVTTHTAALAIERHQSEHVLRDSRDRLTSALNAAGMVGTWDWHIQTDASYCDARLAELCSVDPKLAEEGAPRSTYFSAVHPDDLERVLAAVDRAIASGERFSEDCRLLQKDGSVRWVIARGQCLYDPSGKPLRFSGAVVDVTESRQAELALKESEARLQQALAAGQVMAFEWDPSTGLSKRSENTAQVLGIDRPLGNDGQVNEFLARVHPDDRPRFRAKVYGMCPNSPSYSIKFRYLRPDGKELWLEETAKAEFDDTGKLLRLKGLTRDITDLKRAEEHQNLLIAELDHRVKNTLACVSAIARRSREGNPSMDEFLAVLDGRIHSMANAHALLSRSRWQGVDLAELVHRELAPCVGEGSAVVEGPRVILAAEATQSLAMVLHELVTNATKYGALSTPAGRVSVRWTRRRPGSGAFPGLIVEWREQDGPRVVVPVQTGYGTSVIQDLIPYELGGAVNLDFAADGLRCRMEVPVRWVCDDRASGPSNGSRRPPPPAAGWPAIRPH